MTGVPTVDKTRYILSFIIIMLSIGVNVGQHLLTMMNVDRNYLLITLAAITIAGLLANRHLFFIVLVSALTASINLPGELLTQNHINQDILFATLLAMIVTPAAIKLLGWDAS
jgi:hypothetical protein